MKKKLFAMMLILGLVISQIPEAGVITASAAGARNYLAALEGGSIQWAEVTDGAGKIGTVSGGSQIEFAEYYELPEGSSVELWAVPTYPNRFAGWYTNWNSTDPVLVSSEQVYTWTLPTESGTTLTAVFQEAHQPTLLSALALGVTNGGSVSGSSTDALGTPTPVNGTGTYYYQGASEFTLTAAPENDYTFKGWYSGTFDSSGTVVDNNGTLVSSANPYSFTVAEGTGIALQAVFEPASTEPTPVPGGVHNYLAATGGGTVQWIPLIEGAVYGPSISNGQIEFTGDYALPEGSSIELTAVPAFPNKFLGWYTEWNFDPVLVSSDPFYTWTLPTESGTTLTAAFGANYSGAFAVGVTSGGSVFGSASNVNGVPILIYGTGNHTVQGYSTVTVNASPENDYTFKGWYSGTVDSSGSVVGNDGTLVSAENPYSFLVAENADIALQAVFEPASTEPEPTVLTPIPAVTVNVTPLPAGSSTLYALSAVSVPAGENYFLNQYVAVYDTEPVFDGLGNPVTEPFFGNFEANKTYYMGIALQANPGYMFQQGDEDVANTTVTVNGATLLFGSDLWISNAITDAGLESYGNIIFSFTPAPTAPTDILIDETVDGSKAFIGGVVKLTGSGGTQAGYNFGTLVYNASSIVVPYTEPKTAVVQAHIDAAYTKTFNTANTCKNNGKSGDFSMSFTESTGEEWDNRVTKTFEYNNETSRWEYNDGNGNTEVYIAPAGTDPVTKIHVASGDYGKYTYYSWEANGSVSGWDITVTNDGNGITSANLEASLAGKIVTLAAASFSDCYAFKEWQVVSGGAEPADKTAVSTIFTMPAADVEIKAVFQPTHTLEKTEKVDPECTTPGAEAYWTCSVCHQMFSDEAGTTVITAPVTIPALDHDWGEWTVVKEATETEEGEEARICGRCKTEETRAIPKLKVEYRNTEGGGSEWKKGSDGSLTFVFKRSENDEVTFSHFTGIQMDGKDVEKANYDAVAGSVKITLKPGYLETLSPGKHSITALFNDADPATAGFTVTNPAATPTTAPKTPNTGDNNSLWIWGVLFAAALAGLFAAVNKRSRNSR